MPVSRKCDQCRKVAKCSMHVEAVELSTGVKRLITYLCRECARDLEGDTE